MHQASSRAPERATTPADRLAEFHQLAGHPLPFDGCADCAAQAERQRATGRALRTHQRHARQRVAEILAATCPGCGQSPCACDDTAVDLMLEADALGLYSGGFDDSTEGWGA